MTFIACIFQDPIQLFTRYIKMKRGDKHVEIGSMIEWEPFRVILDPIFKNKNECSPGRPVPARACGPGDAFPRAWARARGPCWPWGWGRIAGGAAAQEGRAGVGRPRICAAGDGREG
jgi:hypothetical protein